MKWLVVIIAGVGILLLSVWLYAGFVGNPRVIEELANDPTGERAGIVMLMTFADGKRLPVNYLREGNSVFVGADGPWWRNFRAGGVPVSLEIRGQVLNGHAEVILDDQDYTREVFSRLRPDAPDWLPDWLNGKLVVITLD